MKNKRGWHCRLCTREIITIYAGFVKGETRNFKGFSENVHGQFLTTFPKNAGLFQLLKASEAGNQKHS
jgi:hypothetical protein